MQFTVTANPGFVPQVLPANLNPQLAGAFPSLPAPTKTRILTLYEVQGPAGPVMVTLDGQLWDNPTSEKPQVGTTEEWVIVDTTADTHPIHLHLAAFELVSRQPFQSKAYTAAWIKANGGLIPPFPASHATVPLDPTPYLQGKPVGPLPQEQAFKDTIQMKTGEVTTIRVRFAPIGSITTTSYPFDATSGPGYVWHCHIIDHEDNEMMRRYDVVP